MVKVSDTIPRNAAGEVDATGWLELLEADGGDRQRLVSAALEQVAGLSERRDELLGKGIELANMLIALNMDDESVAAAVLYRPVRAGLHDLDGVASAVSPAVAELLSAVLRMADSSLLELSNSRMQSSESRDQVENIRRMLVSMIDDARVAVIKQAERVVALRSAKTGSETRKQRIAREALYVFAPLANRLGVWHLKWELEDLALRYLEPDVYKALAGQLDGRRAEREDQVAEIALYVEQRLRERGIEATVQGRAKHIFSIWRKMRAKNVRLDEVYDQRAIRIVVPDIGQCYSALGVVHTEWQHIPREFDDYIAVPKENGYRSIHTAVIGEDGKTLEVQIRTPEIHEEAELGVCAHWSYKEGESEDTPYAQKMNWMRQVVDWQDSAPVHGRGEPIGYELHHAVREERIFVYSPKGHVLDLTTGATPVDFAYRVHTQVGHRCRAARVDGEPVLLNVPLVTGQRVEILTGERDEPQREWLDAHMGFVRTSRAREKIQEWLRARPEEVNARAGQEMIERYLGRLSVPQPSPALLARVARMLGCADVPSMYRALAVADCEILDFVTALTGDAEQPAQLSLLPAETPLSARVFTIDVSARDREGLLLDVTSFLRDKHVSLVSNSGSVNSETGIATIMLGLRVTGVVQLAEIIDGLRQLPGVIEVRRIERQLSRER